MARHDAVTGLGGHPAGQGHRIATDGEVDVVAGPHHDRPWSVTLDLTTADDDVVTAADSRAAHRHDQRECSPGASTLERMHQPQKWARSSHVKSVAS